MNSTAETAADSTVPIELHPFILVHQQDAGPAVAVTVPDEYPETRAEIMAEPVNIFSAVNFPTYRETLLERHVSRVHTQAQDIVRGREIDRAQHGIGGISVAELLSGQSGGATTSGTRWLAARRRHDWEVLLTREQILAEEAAAIIQSRTQPSASLVEQPQLSLTATVATSEQAQPDTVDLTTERLESTSTDGKEHSRRHRILRAARLAGNYAVYAGLTGLAAVLVPHGLSDISKGANNRGTTYLDPINGGPMVTGRSPDAIRHPDMYQIDIHHTGRSIIEAASNFGKGWYEVAGSLALLAGYAIGRSVVKRRPAAENRVSLREAIRIFPVERGPVRKLLYSARNKTLDSILPRRKSSMHSA